MEAGRRLSVAIIVGIVLFGVNGFAAAQQQELGSAAPGTAGEAIELAPVEVMASEAGPEAERQLLSYPSTGIAREEFQDLPNQRLGDVLQRLPGVTMGGPPGTQKDVRLRGLDKEFTRTQFDGVQLTDGGEKREFQVFRFPSFLFDEVSVIRNPTAEFEADGIAGRIDVSLRDIPMERQIDAEIGAGAGTGVPFGRDRALKGAYGERFGNFGVQFGYSHQVDRFVKDKTKRETGGKSETEDEEKDQTFNDLIADLAWFGEQHELHLKPLLLRLDEEMDKTKVTLKPDGSLDKTELEDAEEVRRTLGVIVDHRFSAAAGYSIASNFVFSDTIEDKDKDKTFFKADGSLDKIEDEEEEKKDETLEFGSKVTVPLDLVVPNEIKFGGTLRRRDRFRTKTKLETKGGTTTDKTGPKDSYSLMEYFFAGFVQDTIRITDQVSITPGLRFEHVIQEPTSGAGVTSRETISDFLPSLHAVYRPTDRIAVRASASRQVNRPKFDEIAPFRDEKGSEIVEGNPALEPARAWSFDVGADYAGRDLFLGVNLFHRQIEGVIETVDTGIDIGGKDLLMVENVGDGYVQGVELEQRVSLGLLETGWIDGLSVRANQTIMRSEVEDDLGRTKRFKFQPTFVGNLSLIYEHAPSATTVSLSGNFTSDLPNDEFTGKRDETDSEFRLDFYAETRVYEGISVFGWVENITGEERRKVVRDGSKREVEEEDTGRTFFVGLRARF